MFLNRQIESAKDQQAGINARLDAECFALAEQTNSLRLEVSVHHCCVETQSLRCYEVLKIIYRLQEYLDLNSGDLVNLEDVPKQVVASDCPYPELKACLHTTFRSLTEMYQKKLHTLHQQLGETDRHV